MFLFFFKIDSLKNLEFSQRNENTPDLKCSFREQDGIQYRANANHNHQYNIPSTFVPFALF